MLYAYNILAAYVLHIHTYIDKDMYASMYLYVYGDLIISFSDDYLVW